MALSATIFRLLGALYDGTNVVGVNLALALEEMLPRNSMLFLYWSDLLPA